MSLIEKISNIVQYKIYQATNDPAAAAFAKEQAAAAAKVSKTTSASAKKEPVNTQPSSLTQKIITYTIFSFFIALFILFAIYTGHLAANDAIGRPIAYRILFFLYGTIGCVFVAPYYLIKRLLGYSVRSYALLPIREGDVPPGLDGLFLSLVSYTPDATVAIAKQAYENSLAAAAKGV